MRRWATLVVAASLTLAACARTETRSVNRLAVTGADGSIRSMDGSGGEVRIARGPADGISVLQPTWSPTGRLAWTEFDQENREIVFGDGLRLKAPVAPFYYLWSPDGSVLAFLGSSPTGDGIRLGLADPGEGTAWEIDGGRPYYLDWHPEGQSLAVHVGEEELALVDLEGASEPVGITPGPFQAPEWLPDGRLVVIASSGPDTVAALDGPLVQAGTRQLVIVDAAGSVEVVADLEGFGAFTVSPDGASIAYTDTPGGVGLSLGPLRVVATEGGEPFEVSGEQVVFYQWSPPGDRLLFASLDREAGLLRPQVWDGDGYAEYPGFQPTAVFSSQYLPFWDQFVRGLSLWSPDGTAFAYAAADGDGEEGRIMVQLIGADAPREIARGEFVSWSPA